MDTGLKKLFIERSENELELGKIIFQITTDESIQKNIFHIDEPLTFFSAVITHSYYSIFYATKAYLIKKGIKTKAPEEHKKTYEEFKELVNCNIIDSELLRLYEYVMVQAEDLLKIFHTEKKRRAKFTYQKLSQSNKEPAIKSLENAKKFFKYLNALL